MAHCTITLKVRVAWWVQPYLHMVAWVALFTGRMPNIAKVQARVMRGVRVVQPRGLE